MCIRDSTGTIRYRAIHQPVRFHEGPIRDQRGLVHLAQIRPCLLYTSDAADERSSVDLGGRRIIKKKTKKKRTAADKDT